MTSAPKGYRPSADEAIFRKPTENRAVVPDRVSPAVEGYFRIPAVWIGEAPEPAEAAVLNPRVHHTEAVRKRLASGIEVKVQRDGLFLFDFSAWPLAPITVIPGYLIPTLNGPHTIPREHSDAEIRAEDIAVFRAQVMNAHQACLTTSERMVMNRSAMMGFPVNAWNTYKSLSLDVPLSYADDPEDIRALAHNVLNNKDHIQRHPISRRVLELRTVEHSLDLLDAILLRNDPAIIQLVEAIYISGCRRREKRFGESVVIGWSVCEQLISIAWKAMLNDARASEDGVERMPRERRTKLTGRDYPASVMIEMLEINGRINHELYKGLDIARKARNGWAHEMKPPTERDIHFCHRAGEALLQQVLGIHLTLQAGGRGGVPKWPIWMWEQAKTR
jgi:hypothetical protein